MPRREPQRGPGRPLRGWIIALEDEGLELEKMGIKLGRYNEVQMRFEGCVIHRQAFLNMHAHRDRFSWSLK